MAKCAKCGGSGFVVTERNGVSGAGPCECRAPRDRAMAKFTRAELADAIANLGMCKYFPSSETARAAVKLLLAKMCPHKEALDWLIDTVVNKLGEWPGPAELRGILCTRFDPQDGVWFDCKTTVGFRPLDAFDRQMDEHLALKSGGWTADEQSRSLIADLSKRKLLK